MESLTELSVKVMSEPGDKKQALIDGLKRINESLPGNVYIPFVNNNWRNYAVLNICEEESKLFFTKTRAPYLICLEIYRPEEILVTAQNKYRRLITFSNALPQYAAQNQSELPLTNRMIEGNVIESVLHPFLGRNNQPGDVLPTGTTMINTGGADAAEPRQV